jgi:hypothetical protein
VIGLSSARKCRQGRAAYLLFAKRSQSNALRLLGTCATGRGSIDATRFTRRAKIAPRRRA